MEAEIEVLHPGLFSTIQDRGRYGFREFGVPVSGPMDTEAATLANLLLQQDPGTSVLEITQQGPKLRFSDEARIVVTGALLSPMIENEKIRNNQVVTVHADQVLSFGARIAGCRAYVGIKNGFETGKVLDSQSWSPGITRFSRLEKGMKLSFLKSTSGGVSPLSSVKTGDSFYSNILEAFPGPEFHMLSSGQKELLQKNHFSVGRNSNRMGFQLKELLPNELEPIITAPVLPGTVQLTPSGKLIVLMRDCQTTGGYPRILHLKEAGLNILAQKIPGEKVKFELLDYSLP